MNLPAQASIVVLTYNRKQELLRTLQSLTQLEAGYPIVVVDNGSTDGTASALSARFPGITLIRAPRNLGAAGRNLGVEAVRTPYVAFSDDDTCWEAGALAEALRIFASAPAVGVISARVLVGSEGKLDPACETMARSPLGSGGLPGMRLLGFMAGACVMRTQVFREVKGYWPAFFIGGEEALFALDAAERGWIILYANSVSTRHFPSRWRDIPLRRKLLARNAIWTAWMRLPLRWALAETRRQWLSVDWRERLSVLGLAARGFMPVIARRAVLSERVLTMHAAVYPGPSGRANRLRPSVQ